MTNAWTGTLVSVLAVSLFSFVGALALAGGKRRLGGMITSLVSLAVGGLLGGAFLHLIPLGLEAMGHHTNRVWLMVLIGFIASFALEKSVAAHSHGHGDHSHALHMAERRAHPRPDKRMPVVAVVLTGDAIHNFIDGIVIAAAWSTGPELGVVATFIVLLHEVPQELGDFAILLANGFSIRRAMLWNFLTATTAFAGAFAALIIGKRIDGLAQNLVLLAAGNFIYIAAADLVPQLHERRGRLASALQIVMVIVGVVLMWGIHALAHSLSGHA